MARVGEYVRVNGAEGLVERLVDDEIHCKLGFIFLRLILFNF